MGIIRQAIDAVKLSIYRRAFGEIGQELAAACGGDVEALPDVITLDAPSRPVPEIEAWKETPAGKAAVASAKRSPRKRATK